MTCSTQVRPNLSLTQHAARARLEERQHIFHGRVERQPTQAHEPARLEQSCRKLANMRGGLQAHPATKTHFAQNANAPQQWCRPAAMASFPSALGQLGLSLWWPDKRSAHCESARGASFRGVTRWRLRLSGDENLDVAAAHVAVVEHLHARREGQAVPVYAKISYAATSEAGLSSG